MAPSMRRQPASRYGCMNMEKHQFLQHIRIEAEVLDAWVAEGWLLPDTHADQPTFGEADIARVHLIKDLRTELGVNDEAVGVILDLIDQLHGVRNRLKRLLAALAEEPEEGRDRLAAAC